MDGPFRGLSPEQIGFGEQLREIEINPCKCPGGTFLRSSSFEVSDGDFGAKGGIVFHFELSELDWVLG
ncbi:hypothetical protein CEXT_518371 [Caerostris extrusa]|uniref:Uncharacterized protein n=1 Tax=Caerostris extrusa TaxID=172846 RepID=A0AAV4MFM8_CAEEX|nr:hypothetical protein CEXT_518371 [Caerostris extrusa]